MRRRLTRRLGGLFLITALFGSIPVHSAETGAALSGDEPARYLAEIKRLYLTEDERKALLAHCNDLLQTYALRAGYQVGQPGRQDLLYRLSLGAPGELVVREESRAAEGGQVAVRNSRLSVFGVDPFIRYDCPHNGVSCVLLNPADGSPWLTILRDHNGAAELAKALSFLIRNVQKG
ncbi:hypothetical protein [Pseudomonas indica]|uniref:Uncharacterized protein n=1 Tax=Pseudomonas indica TaxID=137658 RepID=A0A1G8SMD1_9PSED|nr:hypothetical protein [Pseudomonas indica]PAU56321.1 hypothetical protein BZL42_17650 [Pseudomonas indica]SDJ29875.1 hypothetical protein SAMN05216186_10196 [Pseudomonas indica]